MGKPQRICIVGGGSFNWSPTILRDLALTPGISGTVVLHDLNADAAAEMRLLGQKIVEAIGAPLRIETNPDLRESLTAADVVVVTITTGGLEATRHDLEIPRRHGIAQSVGDTVGPGGLSRALRNIPVMVEIARTMERVCPDAWLLNLTNPMTTLVRAVAKSTGVKTVGLCHEVFGTRRMLSQLFAEAGETLEFRVAGINHLIWLLDAQIGSRDALDLLRRHLYGGGTIPLKPFAGAHMEPFQDRWKFKLALFGTYGSLPAAGDRHLAEFFPDVLDEAGGHGAAYGVHLTTIEHRRAMMATARATTLAQIDGSAPLSLKRSEEEVADIAAAIGGGGTHRAVVNLPNRGQIANLPREAVVETMGLIGPTGAHGICVGDLPPGVLSTILPHVLNQEMIVDAALSGDRGLALQALLADPLVRDRRTAPQLLDELLTANAAFLPRFA
ncbi:MAG: hypothetical protein ACR2OO_07710 [Thermomicrobiales bacterium]